MTTEKINKIIAEQKDSIIVGEISDGYHTFYELYYFRALYNAALFNEWASYYNSGYEYDIESTNKKGEFRILSEPKFIESKPKYDVHKSWKHHDGELCFGGGWFIVVAMLPNGQISNHYPSHLWNLFNIPETETAKYEFDGHTSKDVVFRLEYLCYDR